MAAMTEKSAEPAVSVGPLMVSIFWQGPSQPAISAATARTGRMRSVFFMGSFLRFTSGRRG